MIFALVVFAIHVPAQVPGQGQVQVKVWEGKLVIPTYPLRAPNPFPVYVEFQGGRPFYPYPALDSGDSTKVDKTWNAVFLENEYLKVTVLPDMGGKLYSIFDKAANREVLYTNHVVKYGMDVGIRGAWAAGGIEWNFPDGHNVTTVSPVDYTFRQDRDGSAEVVVGDTERMQGMEWQAAIRLRPGIRVVETEILLHNRNPIPGRYWYWSTAAAAAKEDLRFVFPMRVTIGESGEFSPFPKNKGIDYSTWREVAAGGSLFAYNSFRDFMGVYYERSDWGVIHVADHRILPGKKTWTWGTDHNGAVWTSTLTDNDGPYVEFQAGRELSQTSHSYLPPNHADRFVEYWYPVNRLGGPWNEANRDGALRLTVEAGKVRVAVDMNRALENAEVVLEDRAGKVLQTWKTPLKPGAPFASTFNVAGSGPFVVRVRSGEKENTKEWIVYRSDQPVDGNDRFAGMPLRETKSKTPAVTAYESGLDSDKGSYDQPARDAFKRAAADRTYLAPRLALGISYLRTGEYLEAERYLLEASLISPTSLEVRYYLGLVFRSLGKLAEAKDELTHAVASGDWGESARQALGEMAMVAAATQAAQATTSASWQPAIDQLSLSTAPKARTLLAIASRASGNTVRAKLILTQLRRELPLDYLVLNESVLAGEAGAEKELWRLLDREPDHVLELAFDYGALRRVEARAVLEKAIARAGGKGHPMWHYALGWLQERSGDARGARVQYEAGAHADPAYVFPHRLIEMEVLRRALAALPRNSPESCRTAYYLGDVLAGQHRMTEAAEQWRAAGKNDPGNVILFYNLNRVTQAAGDLAGGAAEFDRAVAAAPGEYRLYLLRDDLLARISAPPARRLALLEAAPDPVRKQWQVALHLGAAYIAAGRLEEGSAVFEKMSFPPEAAGQVADARRSAEKALAGQLAKAGRHAEAAAALEKSVSSSGQPAGSPAPDVRPKALLEIADLLERGRKHEEAQSWVEKAAAWPGQATVAPADITIEDDYYRAMALAKLRRFVEARVFMDRVAGRDPDGPLGRDAVLTLRHWKAAGVIQ
jgi:tetratricopeptide (TPR) repeat protein